MIKKRKPLHRKGQAIATPHIIALATKYAFGYDNRKKSKWLADKLLEEDGIQISPATIQKVIAKFPRGGYAPSRQGGLYIIATRSEALATIQDIEKRAYSLLERANELKALYEIKD